MQLLFLSAICYKHSVETEFWQESTGQIAHLGNRLFSDKGSPIWEQHEIYLRLLFLSAIGYILTVDT